MTTQDLQLSKIVPSRMHLRRIRDKEADVRLRENIARLGILQPIIVRPIGEQGGYELVAGHRRYDAAVAVKLETIPAVVRELDDAQALEVQVVENQQRADVHPLEEAEGYRLLTEKHGYSVEQVAAKVGKSKAYVYGRMRLGALGGQGREAFLAGKLDAATALLVARIPERLQKDALKGILTGGPWVGDAHGPMTYRGAVEFVHSHFMLRLEDAPFDTADNELPGGGCGACIKRTGNDRDLFGDVKGPDICTDPQCYQCNVAVAAKRRLAQLKAEGKTILPRDRVKKSYPSRSSRPDYNSEFLDLDSELWVGNRKVKVSALLRQAKPEIPTVFGERHDGVIVELAPRKALELAARKLSRKSTSGKRQEADPKAARRIAENRRRMERATLVRLATTDLVMEKLPNAKDTDLWIGLSGLMANFLNGVVGDPETDRMLARYGAKSPKDWNKLGTTLREIIGSDVGRARAIVTECLLTAVSEREQDLALRELTKLLRITPEQVKRRAKAEQAAAAEREKQRKAKRSAEADSQAEPDEESAEDAGEESEE